VIKPKFIIVRISCRRYVVAQLDDAARDVWFALTRPLDRIKVARAREEIESKPIEDYSDFTRSVLLD
jgi:hypothetical protein